MKTQINCIHKFDSYFPLFTIYTDNNECDTRGLELATDIERKQRKHCANKIIVTAQKSMKANELCTLSLNLSSWARENAIKNAEIDFLAACDIYLR